MNQLEPTYLRFVYDGLKKGSLNSQNSSSLPNGFIGLFEQEFSANISMFDRRAILTKLGFWALFKGAVSSEMASLIFNKSEDDTKALIDKYSKWFNSPSPGKYSLYHDRLRAYLLQKLGNHELKELNEKLISYLEKSLEDNNGDESEIYALEHLSTHMLVESQLNNNYKRFHEYVNKEVLWPRQISTSKEYKWSQNGVQQSIKEAARRDNNKYSLISSINSVKLIQDEEDSTDDVMRFLEMGDYIISLKRIENWSEKRKLVVLVLMIQDLTIGYLNKKSFKKEACLSIIDELKKIDYDGPKIDLFPTILRYNIHTELKKIEIETQLIWLKFENNFDEFFKLNNSSLNEDLISYRKQISNKKKTISESKKLLTNYTEQLKKIEVGYQQREKNSLKKEIEYQQLEIEIAKKQIIVLLAQVDDLKVVNYFINQNRGINFIEVIKILCYSTNINDYYIFIDNYFNLNNSNLNDNKDSHSINGEIIFNRITDLILEKHKHELNLSIINHEKSINIIEQIKDFSLIDRKINYSLINFYNGSKLNKVESFSASNIVSQEIVKKFYDLKGNIFDKLSILQNSKDLFNYQNSKILQNAVLEKISQMKNKANVTDNSRFSLYCYYGSISNLFENPNKTFQIINNGLLKLDIYIDKYKNTLLVETKNQSENDKIKSILNFEKNYNNLDIENYLNGKMGGFYAEQNVIRKKKLFDAVGCLNKTIYFSSNSSLTHREFIELINNVFIKFFNVIDKFVEIFYYDDFYNLRENDLNDFFEQIKPLINDEKSLNNDIQLLLIYKHLEVHNFINSKVKETLLFQEYLIVMISDLIRKLISENKKNKILELSKIVITINTEIQVFTDDTLELLISYLIKEKRNNEVEIILNNINIGVRSKLYLKFLEVIYPNKMNKSEVNDILDLLSSNLYFNNDFELITNKYIFLINNTKSIRLKKTIFYSFLNKIDSFEIIESIKLINSLIKNSFFNFRIQILNEVLNKKIIKILDSNNGENICKIYSNADLTKHISASILKNSSNKLSIEAYISIAEYLKTNPEIFDFNKIIFFADSLITLSFNQKNIRLEDINEKNIDQIILNLNAYFSFYKILEGKSRSQINWDITAYYYSIFHNKLIEFNDIIHELSFDRILSHNHIDNRFTAVYEDFPYLHDNWELINEIISNSYVKYSELPGLIMFDQWEDEANPKYNNSILFEYALLFNLNNRLDLAIKCMESFPSILKDLTFYYLCKNFIKENNADKVLEFLNKISTDYFKILVYIDIYAESGVSKDEKIYKSFKNLITEIKNLKNDSQQKSLYNNFYSVLLSKNKKVEYQRIEYLIKNNYGDECFIPICLNPALIGGIPNIINPDGRNKLSDSIQNIDDFFDKILKNQDRWSTDANGNKNGWPNSEFFNFLDYGGMYNYKNLMNLVYNSNDTEKKSFLNNEIESFKYIYGSTETWDDSEISDNGAANIFLLRAWKAYYLNNYSKSVSILNKFVKYL